MATTDIQPLLDSQPPALSSNVPRVKADGLPTTHLIDWEFYQTDWFKSNIIAVDTRIDEVKTVADGVSAAVQDETNARVSADEALAERITTVEAVAGQGLANGEIYFAAMADPAGSVATYGIFLKAGAAYTGFQMFARSDGSSAIGLSASQFTLIDSGSAQQVFNYSSGVFTFNVPIRVGTNDIGLSAINSPAATTALDLVNLGTSTGGGWHTLLSVSNTGGPGQVAVVSADLEYAVQGIAGTYSAAWRVIRNDGLVLAYSLLPEPGSSGVLVSLQRLDTSFGAAYTYSLDISFDISGSPSTPPAFLVRGRGLMIDLRKR